MGGWSTELGEPKGAPKLIWGYRYLTIGSVFGLRLGREAGGRRVIVRADWMSSCREAFEAKE